jgi:ribosomal protein L44E
VLVHQKGKFIASVNYYANAVRGEKNVLVWSFKSDEEIKQGQERIDRKTVEPGAADRPVAATKPGKKAEKN